MNKPVVSIIVPVYNTADYLPKCLDSLLDQTLTDIEIICVDDGSTDASPEILDEYGKKDSRVIVIHQENGGSASARNAALDAAKGTYIGFSDSDDYANPDMFEKLVLAAREKNAEVVICGANIYPEEPRAGQWLYDSLTTTEAVFSKYDPTLSFSNPQTNNFLWRTLIKREVINSNQIRFDPMLHLGEDKTFLSNVYPCVDTIAVIPDQLYNYCWHREGSLMDTLAYVNNDAKLQKHVLLVEKIAENVKNRDLQGESEEFLKWMIPFLYIDFIYQSRNDKIDFANRIDNVVKSLNKFYLIPHLENYMVNDYSYIEKFTEVKKTEKPICSVILYIDGNSRYVKEITNAFKNAEETGAEIIIINNGAWGKDYEYIKALMENNPDVRLYNTPCHMDRNEAFNYGISLSVGEYLLFMNAHDRIDLEKAVDIARASLEKGAEIISMDITGSCEIGENEFVHAMYNVQWLKDSEIRLGDNSVLSGKIFYEKAKAKAKVIETAEDVLAHIVMADVAWFGPVVTGKYMLALEELVEFAVEQKDDTCYQYAYELLCSDFTKNMIKFNMGVGADFYIDDEETSNQITIIKTLYRLVMGLDTNKVKNASNFSISDVYNVLNFAVTERQRLLNN